MKTLYIPAIVSSENQISLFESRIRFENVTNKPNDRRPGGVRYHNAITAFFLSFFGKIVKTQDINGKIYYLNKQSLVNYFNDLNDTDAFRRNAIGERRSDINLSEFNRHKDHYCSIYFRGTGAGVWRVFECQKKILSVHAERQKAEKKGWFETVREKDNQMTSLQDKLKRAWDRVNNNYELVLL